MLPVRTVVSAEDERPFLSASLLSTEVVSGSPRDHRTFSWSSWVDICMLEYIENQEKRSSSFKYLLS